ncbi:MAG: hypothetical protein ACI8VJ_000998, partial [Polaribacter sp.]
KLFCMIYCIFKKHFVILGFRDLNFVLLWYLTNLLKFTSKKQPELTTYAQKTGKRFN